MVSLRQAMPGAMTPFFRQTPHRPGTAPALRLRAGGMAFAFPAGPEPERRLLMSQDFSRLSARRRPQAGRAERFRPSVEVLEDRLALAAQAIDFTIDPASSTLSLSGTLTTPAGSQSAVEQPAGPPPPSLPGSIGPLVDFAASSILFREAGTSLDAAVSGSWSPRPGGLAGTSPADYGGKFDVGLDPVFIAVHDTAGTL